MSELDNCSSTGERPEMLVDRREVTGAAAKLFAKYTAPAMLVALMASSGKVIAVSGDPEGEGRGRGRGR